MLYRLLILVHICKAFPFKCPEQAQWSLRAGVHCPDTSKYFCLKNYLISGYSENCTAIGYRWPGEKVVLRGRLNAEMCSSMRFQPIKFYTNANTNCIFLKSTCYEEGQLIYDKESSMIDTYCRCDYTKGYDFLIKPQNPCFCVPSKEDCSCYLKTCPNSNDRLSPDYECIQKEKNLTKCKNNIYKRLNATIHENTIEYIKRIEFSSKEETIKIDLIILSICIVVIILVIVICGLCILQNRQYDLNEAQNSQNILHFIENKQPDQNESIYDIYDEIDESQMIDMPLQHMPTEYEDNENSSSVAANEEINDGDGYLNPYLPMVSDVDHHGYCIRTSNTT